MPRLGFPVLGSAWPRALPRAPIRLVSGTINGTRVRVFLRPPAAVALARRLTLGSAWPQALFTGRRGSAVPRCAVEDLRDLVDVLVHRLRRAVPVAARQRVDHRFVPLQRLLRAAGLPQRALARLGEQVV